MKTENKKTESKKTAKPKGTGHRAKVGLDLAITWEIDNEKHTSKFNCEGIITMEEIQYKVHEIMATVATAVAAAANNVAAKMADGQGAPSARASESVTA